MSEDILGQVDICIVMDTTGSMAGYIAAAKEEARKQAEEIAKDADLNIRYAIVEYRDHPPQDYSFVTRVYPFSSGETFQVALEGLFASGGGDEPEAVLDGLVDAAKLQWRPQADKLCFLIGDSPPHGAGEPSQWPKGCPCRATPNGVVELFASQNIKLHALSIAGNPVTTKAFAEMAEAIPGGTIKEVDAPAAAIYGVAASVGASAYMIGASRSYAEASAYLAAAGVSVTPETVSNSLGWTSEMGRGTHAYMASRGIDPLAEVKKKKPWRSKPKK